MLKQISCDKFIKNGVKRPPINFDKGLNVILGEDKGSNSIGKSTLLMIIDFVFGGDDYIYRCKEVKDAIGDHTINFKFEFSGKEYYFSRSTNNHETVNICDSNYNILGHFPLDEYSKQIAAFYKLDENELTLRAAIGPYSRIYHRETLNEERPINAAFREKTKDAIFKFIKLHKKYSSLIEINKEYEEAKSKLDTIKKAQEYKYVAKINQDSYNKNKKELSKLQDDLVKLEKENEIGLGNKERIKSERHNQLLNQIEELESARNSLISERNKLQVEPIKKDGDFQKLLGELSKYFNVKVQDLSQIESFHIQLSNILNIEYKVSLDKINTSIEYLNKDIENLQDEYKKLERIDNVSKAILAEHLRLNTEIDRLSKENQFYEIKCAVNEEEKVKKAELESSTTSILIGLQNDINSKLKDLANDSFGSNNPPKLTLNSLERYYFKTPFDGGTGTQQKGLILFDLITLNTTNLPIVIHDSVLLKNIEDKSLGIIINEYTKTNKQVFIAYDRASTYSHEIYQKLIDNTRITLGENGNELFGYSFTKKIEEDKKKAE